MSDFSCQHGVPGGDGCDKCDLLLVIASLEELRDHLAKDVDDLRTRVRCLENRLNQPGTDKDQ